MYAGTDDVRLEVFQLDDYEAKYGWVIFSVISLYPIFFFSYSFLFLFVLLWFWTSYYILKCTSFSGRARGGQVNKSIEVKSLEIYCSTFQSDANLMSSDNTGDSKCWSIVTAEGDESNKFNHILKPLDVLISLTVSMLPHK